MKIGVLATIILGALIGYPIASFGGLAPDSDGDGVPDVLDNCKFVSNPSPLNCDSDTDGVGNRCDCDITNAPAPPNGLNCAPSDFTAFRTQYNAGGTAVTDMGCNGVGNNPSDFTLFRNAYNNPAIRGSGLSCAGTIGCN